MAKGIIFLAIVFLALNCRHIAGKSLRKPKLKDHAIKKRSSYFLWQDTCPPPAFLSVAEVKCKDECHSNDDCIGNLLCCDNGCKMCLEPVLPPPVIDWLGSPSSYHRGFAAGGVPENNHIEVDLTEPHVEEVECTYKGNTYARGESFLKGCHKCQCRFGGISCEVGPCKVDKNSNQGEHSGEASGVDVSQLNPVQALELSGDDDENDLQVYPTKAKSFESLRLHREESEEEGEAEVRVIHSTPEQTKPRGNEDNSEISGLELNGEIVPIREELFSGEEENRNHLQQLTTSTETTEQSGHGFIEKIKVRRLPKFRRIVRKQPKKDEELYKNVLMI